MATPIASWNVTYTDTDGQRQRATGLADWDAAQAEAKRLRAAGARWVKTHPQFATLSDTFAYANRNAIAAAQDRALKDAYADREAAQERAAYLAEMAAEDAEERAWQASHSLFTPELDGDTFVSLEALAEYHQGQAEYDAEAAYERHLETNDQYRWEVEEDERRAAAFGA